MESETQPSFDFVSGTICGLATLCQALLQRLDVQPAKVVGNGQLASQEIMGRTISEGQSAVK